MGGRLEGVWDVQGLAILTFQLLGAVGKPMGISALLSGIA
jgi:hypothetical protein